MAMLKMQVIAIGLACAIIIFIANRAAAVHGDCCFPVLLGYQPDLSFSGLFAGIDKGVFRKENFDVKTVKLANSGSVIKEMLAGKVGVGAITVSAEALQALGAARDLRIVADGGQSTPENAFRSRFMVSARSAPAIKNLASLGGKRVGVVFPNDTIDYYGFVKQLERVQLKETDVQMVRIRTDAEVVRALKEGIVDVVVVSEPLAGILRTERLAVPIGQGLPLQTGLILYSPGFSKSQPAAIHFTAAYLESLRNFRNRPIDRETAAIIERYTGVSTRQAVPVFYSFDGQPNIDNIINFQTWLVQRKTLKEGVELKEKLDLKFLPR